MKRRLSVLLLAPGVLGFVLACDGRAINPTSPTLAGAKGQPVGNTGQEPPAGADSVGVVTPPRSLASTFEVCHRTGADQFVPLTIPEAALDAHLRHGDGRIGFPVVSQPGQRFGPGCQFVAQAPVTITFSGLAANGSPVPTYSESGFTLQAVSGPWEALTTYGQPAPSLIFKVLTQASASGQVSVTGPGGAPFRFTAVDVYASVTPIPFVFEGLVGSTPQFTVGATQPNTFGNFVTVVNPHAGSYVDVLKITLTSPDLLFCTMGSGSACNAVGLDNIALLY